MVSWRAVGPPPLLGHTAPPSLLHPFSTSTAPAPGQLNGLDRRVVLPDAPDKQAAVAPQAQQVVAQHQQLQDVARVPAAVDAAAVHAAALDDLSAHSTEREVSLAGQSTNAVLHLQRPRSGEGDQDEGRACRQATREAAAGGGRRQRAAAPRTWGPTSTSRSLSQL